MRSSKRLVWFEPLFFLFLFFSSQGFAAQGSQTADLAIQVTSLQQTMPKPGEFVDFVVKVSNQGPEGTFLSSRVEAHLPPEYTEITWNCTVNPPLSVGAPCSACPAPHYGTGNINEDVGLTTGTSLIFNVHARVPKDASNPLIYSASVTAPSWVVDPNAANNQDSVSLMKGSDLSISLQATPNPGTGHQPVSVIGNICNSGPYAAEGVSFQFSLPQGGTIQSAEGKGFNCNGVGAQLLCERVPLVEKDGCIQIQFTVIPPPALELIPVQASVSSSKTQELSPANNTAKLQFGVVNPDKLALTGGGLSCSTLEPSQPLGIGGFPLLFGLMGCLFVGHLFMLWFWRRRKTTELA